MHPGKSFPQKCHFHSTAKCHVVTSGHVTTVGCCGYDKMIRRLLGCPNRIQKESGETLDVSAYTEVAQLIRWHIFNSLEGPGHVGTMVGGYVAGDTARELDVIISNQDLSPLPKGPRPVGRKGAQKALGGGGGGEGVRGGRAGHPQHTPFPGVY